MIVVSGGVSLYRRLFAVPGSSRLAAADLCARLPQGMLSLTVLLVVAQQASMRVAGLALAGCTAGLALTAPVRGRLADRYGVTRIAALCCVAFIPAALGLLGVVLARQPAVVLIALATAVGLVMPPLSPGLRKLWSVQAPAELVQTAFALDAAVFDLAYITGPVVASSVAVGVAPAAALGVLLGLTVAAVAVIGNRFPPETSPVVQRIGLGPLRSAALRRLLVTAALTNVALTATEVALTASMRLNHSLWAIGPLLAELSVGSILGSLLLGTRAPASSTRRRLPRFLAAYTGGLVALTAAALVTPLLLAVATPLAGLFLGPTLATLFTSTSSAVPHGNGTEAQAWLNSTMNGGAAGGAALAGLFASQPIVGLGLGAGAAAVAALAATLLRGEDS